jgi:hypothetical protein
MAVDRLRVIADELLVTIKQTFDDKQVSQAQVAYWVIIVGNQLLGQHNAKRDSGAFLSTFTGIPVQVVKKSVNPDIVAGRKFIEIPGHIFDYDKDGGVEYIAYYRDEEPECTPDFHRKTIQRTSPGELQWLMKNKYTEPNLKNPYWYRTGDIIYLVGLEKSPVRFIEIGLYLTIDPLEKIDIDKPFHFPAELLHVLKRQVVDLARFSFLFPSDNSNDGSDTTEESNKQIPKIQSVNQNQQE